MRWLVVLIFCAACRLWAPIDAVELCLQRELASIEALPDEEYQRRYNEILSRYEPVFWAYRTGNYELFEQALITWGGCPI